MAKSLSPFKFYGGALPRPRLYADVKFNDDRLDPPPSVTDPLLSWARDAHWSMGGMNFTRRRLQGRIEGSIRKLRSQEDEATAVKKRKKGDEVAAEEVEVAAAKDTSGEDDVTPVCSRRALLESPPPAPYAMKRRRLMAAEDDERRDLIKNLKKEFDSVADFESVARRTRSRGIRN